MPRSWHSGTSYLNFRATVSPHSSQTRAALRLMRPHSGQVTSVDFTPGETNFLPQPLQVVRRFSIPMRLPHLHSHCPMEYSTNSSEQVSRKSVMGNTDLNTACSPASSRSAGAVYIWRKRS